MTDLAELKNEIHRLKEEIKRLEEVALESAATHDGIEVGVEYNAPPHAKYVANHVSYDGPESPIGTGPTVIDAIADLRDALDALDD